MQGNVNLPDKLLGFNMALGGTIATPVAWLGMGLFILWLVWTKRLPVESPLNEMEASVG
ncbi:MAG: hypothetical protein NTW69_03000 [Chloroflexi bacterium]|nr:hypothetical protein [Chloroflexota bacterium]